MFFTSPWSPADECRSRIAYTVGSAKRMRLQCTARVRIEASAARNLSVLARSTTANPGMQRLGRAFVLRIGFRTVFHWRASAIGEFHPCIPAAESGAAMSDSPEQHHRGRSCLLYRVPGPVVIGSIKLRSTVAVGCWVTCPSSYLRAIGSVTRRHTGHSGEQPSEPGADVYAGGRWPGIVGIQDTVPDRDRGQPVHQKRVLVQTATDGWTSDTRSSIQAGMGGNSSHGSRHCPINLWRIAERSSC
jgi:hypothetical protein